MSMVGLSMFLVAAHALTPKHVLMVVIDDLGYDDLGFRNSKQIKTPTFDKLAQGGIELSQYYVQPSCSPTRAALLSGRKPLHTGINFWIPNSAYGLRLNESTLADVLNALGFISHAVGKWHLGFFKTEYTPTFRGFSSFYGYYEGSEDYFAHTTSGGYDLHDEPTPRCGLGCTTIPWDEAGEYSTNLFSRRAIGVIEKHDADAAGLFLFLAYQGVHAPRQAPALYVKPYEDSIADPSRRTFAGMVSALDEGLANVTGALGAKGMLDDTLIIVTTDNGGPTTECSTTGQSNWPFRGSKCSVWEGGTRGTSFVYWAGLRATSAISPYGGLAHAADWLPTIVSALGAAPLRPNETLPLDGVDLWPSLVAGAASPRADVYYGISQDHKGPAVRDTDGFKLILSASGGGAGMWSRQQLPNASSMSVSVVLTIEELGIAAAAPARELLLAEGAAPDSELLYSLPADPGEHSPLPLDDPQNAAIAQRLRTRISEYEHDKVPQQTGDPSCPDFAPRNASQGKWIGPWCD